MTQPTVFETNTWCAVPSDWSIEGLNAYEKITSGPLLFARASDGKFGHDKWFHQTAHGFLLLEGVILNKHELVGTRSLASAAEHLAQQFSENGVSPVLRKLRGPFSGAWYDNELDVLWVFANQTGETAAYTHRRLRFASNSFDLMATISKENSVALNFSQRAAKQMLSFGFMVDGSTFAEEITRVLPGMARSIDSKSAQTDLTYWRLDNAPNESITFDEAVQEIERLFRQANQRALSKDLEYGYETHLVDLSGGMDTRAVNFALRSLKAHEIVNITYSESGSREHKHALETARALRNWCLYMPLDGGASLLDPVTILRLNGGSAYYGGITGGKKILELVSQEAFGLEHTGMLGDVVLGTFCTEDEQTPPTLEGMQYSRANSSLVSAQLDSFPNDEIFKMETRGFLGAVSTYLTRSHFTYPTSPFLDVDLLEYAFSLPPRIRINHRLYNAWLSEFHPHALRIPSTRRMPGRHTRAGNVARGAMLRILEGVPTKAQGLLNRRSSRRAVFPFARTSGMNPFEVWYAVNPDLRRMIESYKARAKLVDSDAILRQALHRAFKQGSSVNDKLLAVSVVAMHEIYFS